MLFPSGAWTFNVDKNYTKVSKAPLGSHRLIPSQGGFLLQGTQDRGRDWNIVCCSPSSLFIPSPFSFSTHYISMLLQNVQICISPGLPGVAFGKAPRGRRVKEQQKKVGRREEGGGHRRGDHAHVHLQCLMNDEDNDWWYLGGLGENTWVVLPNTHTETHTHTASWLRHGHCSDKTV